MPSEQDNRKILTACRDGDQQALESLLQEFDIGPGHCQMWMDRSIPEEQQTPRVHDMLAAAIRGQHLEIVKFLFSKFHNTSLGTLLGLAIQTGNVEFVESLCGIDPDSADAEDDYRTILVDAVTSGDEKMVGILLKAGADPNRPACRALPWNVAYYAVTGEKPASMFEVFFDHGYLVDHWTLREAVERERLEVVEVLLRRGEAPHLQQATPVKELLSLAEENKDWEMVDLIQRMHPDGQKRPGKGLADRISKLFNLK
ncbi:unnamed protein product [Clonostachys rosea f. rosea IK726]|jgi:hypothetical protein|uniref:Uncharacterized protein n=1 Tax=Clonostachys rosea f. rosea IK726 TaxID=1349383 RepID=A0ACA9ULG2_BIOOC|nr:unnamed protein product [Clonostachys rosea f. rosea IK726]